jgi:hypothetical protein
VGAGGIGGLEVGEVLLLLALPTRFGFPEDMALRANGEWNEGSSDYLCVCVCVCLLWKKKSQSWRSKPKEEAMYKAVAAAGKDNEKERTRKREKKN